jgi:hypothetical protein
VGLSCLLSPKAVLVLWVLSWGACENSVLFRVFISLILSRTALPSIWNIPHALLAVLKQRGQELNALITITRHMQLILVSISLQATCYRLSK